MFYRRWFVCLSVTTITKKIVDGFVPNFMGRFLGGMEDQVRVSLRSVERCGCNGQKNSVKCKQSPVYSSSLIVGEASVAKCWRQKNLIFAFAGSCTLLEYFPYSCYCFGF